MTNRLLIACFLTVVLKTAAAQTLALLPQNPHYFTYQGKPTVVVGSGEHYGAVMNLGFNYDKYLQTLQKEELNTTRLFTGAYYEKPGAFGIQKNTLAPAEDQLILPWKKSNGKYDLTAWNEAFFARLHDFMKKSAQSGVIVEICLFSAYYGAGWAYHPFNGNNNNNQTPTDLAPQKVNTLDNGAVLKFQEAYTRKLVQELNQYDNFYFEIQNEPWAEGKDTILVWNDFVAKEDLKQPSNSWKSTLEVASEKSQKWHQAVSSWIVDQEKSLPKKHLISHNIANFKMPAFAADPNISIYTFHYALPEAATINYALNKVVGFNETGFAGKSDDTYRRQAWRFMMSGGGLFGHLDYSFSVGQEEGTDLTNNAPGGGSPTLRSQFKLLKNTLESTDLATLQPSGSFLGPVEGAFVYPMKDKRSYLVYMEPILPKSVAITVKLPKGKYTLAWKDVLTGKTLKSEKLEVTSPTTILQSPEGIHDKIAIITK